MPTHKPHPDAVRIAVAEPFNPLSLRWVRGIRAAKQQMPGGTVTVFRAL